MTRRETLMTVLLAVAVMVLTVAVALPVLAQADPEANDPGFWCEPEQGIKLEPVDTPFIVPEPLEGTTWTLLVLKGGTSNETVVNPIPGQGYAHSTAANSHVILCWETTTTTTSSTTTSSTTTSLTTTTDPATTTSSSTSTTDPGGTTTTSPTTTTTPTTSSTSTSTSTVPPTTTTTPVLPNTGFDNTPLTVAAAALILVGLAVLAGSYLYQRDE